MLPLCPTAGMEARAMQWNRQRNVFVEKGKMTTPMGRPLSPFHARNTRGGKPCGCGRRSNERLHKLLSRRRKPRLQNRQRRQGRPQDLMPSSRAFAVAMVTPLRTPSPLRKGRAHMDVSRVVLRPRRAPGFKLWLPIMIRAQTMEAGRKMEARTTHTLPFWRAWARLVNPRVLRRQQPVLRVNRSSRVRRRVLPRMICMSCPLVSSNHGCPKAGESTLTPTQGIHTTWRI
mmetsp:Transcript_18999/g.57467  ORF Transcript_18999/g.57467 Transcript_18999/m.57467 type:complete len:230 (+) Transcript_18999:783-1472(+)